MIPRLIILTACILPFFAFSGVRKQLPSIWIMSDSIYQTIHADSVELVFNLIDSDEGLMLNQHPAIIQVKIDGKTNRFTITNERQYFKLKLAKGKHQLSFYMNANFNELHFNNELFGSHHYEIAFNFRPSYRPVINHQVEKPVIYLYSESEKNFNLKIKTDAQLQFTYPTYENEWNGTATKNGTIQLNGKNYPYLFWDAELPVEQLKLNWQNSEQILGEQTIEYLSTHLDQIGFNPKEKTDFITYWGPRMQKMKFIQVLWIQNESINEIASLDLSSEFEQNRVYIVFKEIPNLTDETRDLKPRVLTPVKRTANYLIEWGGIEIRQINNFN